MWFHGEASKGDTNKVLDNQPDGTFLIRTRPKQKDMALGLVYKGQVTHHLIEQSPEGIYVINGMSYGNPRSLRELVDRMRVAQPNWPQPFVNFVPRPEATDLEIEAEEQRAKVIRASVVEAEDEEEAQATPHGHLRERLASEATRDRVASTSQSRDARGHVVRHWFVAMTKDDGRHVDAEDLVLAAYRLGAPTTLPAVSAFLESVDMQVGDPIEFTAFQQWFATHPNAAIWEAMPRERLEVTRKKENE